MFDFSGIAKGSFVTVDFTQDDPKAYEVQSVDQNDAIIMDIKTKKCYKVPLSKIAIEDITSPYVEDELDTLYSLDGKGDEDETPDMNRNLLKDEKGSGDAPATNQKWLDNIIGDRSSIKKRGVKLSILKKSLDKMANNRVAVSKNKKDSDKPKK
jgi:hypothetical protein